MVVAAGALVVVVVAIAGALVAAAEFDPPVLEAAVVLGAAVVVDDGGLVVVVVDATALVELVCFFTELAECVDDPQAAATSATATTSKLAWDLRTMVPLSRPVELSVYLSLQRSTFGPANHSGCLHNSQLPIG